MKIFFVRHGESTMNASHSHQSPLTRLSPLGMRQAHTVAGRLSSIHSDIILSSNCIRARQTARIIARKLGKRIEYSDLLNETRGVSDFFGKKWNHEKAVAARKVMYDHLEDPGWHYSDEENYSEIRRRAVRIIKYLSGRKEKELIVVTHGYILSVLLFVALFGEKVRIRDLQRASHLLRLDNTGITECEMDEKGQWTLVTWNDHGHVKAASSTHF